MIFLALTFGWAFVLIIVAVMLNGCSQCSSTDIAIPRRVAYPRVAVYDSVFSAIDKCPVYFEANDGAEVTTDTLPIMTGKTSSWTNIFYPNYDATIYCTFTKVVPATIANVIDNRIERMALNSGGLTSALTEFSNDNGFESRILVTPEATATPVQFLSTDNVGWVVSGVMYLKNADEVNPDSIVPIVGAVERDIIHALKTIRHL